ncbi:TetR/AcrR family transcriptional regulator [Devosia sp. CN2-171]|uniref:TetR/AcrR family transcriptional regulator n=1 Tax=Devosia sp. CN2-171 TaxID=3400909 RepID=UPI003BF8C965
MTELAPPITDSGPRGPNFRRYEGRREQMIDAALEVFFDKGYDRARIEDVARLSGVGKSAVLYHFGSKLALVASVVAKHCLPATPLGGGAAEQMIEASLADPAAPKVLRFVMTEQRRLPSLGRLYVVAIMRRVGSSQGFGNVEAIRAGVGQAFGRMAARVLFEGYPAVEGERHGSNPV